MRLKISSSLSWHYSLPRSLASGGSVQPIILRQSSIKFRHGTPLVASLYRSQSSRSVYTRTAHPAAGLVSTPDPQDVRPAFPAALEDDRPARVRRVAGIIGCETTQTSPSVLRETSKVAASKWRRVTSIASGEKTKAQSLAPRSLAPGGRNDESKNPTISGSNDALKVRRLAGIVGFGRKRAPASTLRDSLRETGFQDALPARPRRKCYLVDHSYISPHELQRRNDRQGPHHHATYLEDAHDIPTEITLQSILASYIRLHKPLLEQSNADAKYKADKSLIKAFNDEALQYLAARGYDIQDVITWAWIITPTKSTEAATRLLAVANYENGVQAGPIPTFVFLFLLRRARVSLPALRMLIAHGWDRLKNRVNPEWHALLRDRVRQKTSAILNLGSTDNSNIAYRDASYPVMSEQTLMIMVVRLLRHSWQWPAAIPHVVQMLTSHITRPREGDINPNALPLKSISRLAFLYNRLLRLISKPVLSPFLSVTYQERAQFNVIRRMSQYEPPLLVNKEGYRAVIKVQLAHRKAMAERLWSNLKSKAWPPWREDRLGIDATKSDEGGISRANRAIRTLTQSGYAAGPWENAASILSGWDTDFSPTIQKRTIFSPRIGQDFILNRESEEAPMKSLIWEARVRATRTVSEAWACFLGYQQEEENAAVHANIHTAMLEKVVYEDKRRQELDRDATSEHDPEDQEASLASGDMLEVEAPSTNPREMTYTRVPPPEPVEFIRTILEKGIAPKGRLLALMLNSAKTIGEGFQYLRASGYPPACVASLLRTGEIDVESLEELPRIVFIAWIGLLTRFPKSQISESSYRFTNTSRDQIAKLAMLHAIDLVQALRPGYPTPWNLVLSAIAENPATQNTATRGRASEFLDCWSSLMSMVQRMEDAEVGIDFATLLVLSDKFHKTCRHARASGVRVGLRSDGPLGEDISANALAIVLKQGVADMKRMFRNLVSLDLKEAKSESPDVSGESKISDQAPKHYRADSLMPRFLQVPNPAHLHAFMRALGTVGDHEGILDLLQWMGYASPELRAVSQELRNGPRMFRLALVAARLYLERSWEPHLQLLGASKKVAAAQDIVDRATSIVNGIGHWDGWPTDDEVYRYCKKGHWTF